MTDVVGAAVRRGQGPARFGGIGRHFNGKSLRRWGRGPQGVGGAAVFAAGGLDLGGFRAVAEREGFEPSMPGTQHTRSPGALLKPLGHLSAAAQIPGGHP
jgi:hypothetical protein